MAEINYYYYENSPEENRFKSFDDFEDCMIRGGEVEFIYNKKIYSITHYDGKTGICEAYKPETEFLGDTADEILEYIIDGVKLRDIITKVEVIIRTI